MEGKEVYDLELTKNEYNLVRFLRKFKYGKVTISVSNGIPMQGEHPLKSIHFGKGFDDDDVNML